MNKLLIISFNSIYCIQSVLVSLLVVTEAQFFRVVSIIAAVLILLSEFLLAYVEKDRYQKQKFKLFILIGNLLVLIQAPQAPDADWFYYYDKN